MKNCTQCNKQLTGNQQKFCCNACKQKDHWHKKKKQPNTYHSQTKRAFKRKLDFINKLGGACSICGYNTNIAALEFNHIDPSTKLFGIDSRKISNTNIQDLLKEVEKCELLCSNCHREHHYKEMDMKNVKKVLNL